MDSRRPNPPTAAANAISIRVDLSPDPATGHWTATVVPFGASGRGATAGRAVDDILFGLKPRIAAIDALAAAGDLTATWRERRQAMAAAQKAIMGAAVLALVDIAAILKARRSGASLADPEGTPSDD